MDRGAHDTRARSARRLRGLDRGHARTRPECGMRHRLEYAAVAAARRIVGVLPYPVVRALGAAVGLSFYAIDRTHRRVALANLTQCFPTRSEAERRTIARAVFAHFGHLLFEILKFSTLSHAEMLKRVEFDGEERARAAYAQGKGV